MAAVPLVALATCREFSELDVDDWPFADALRARGVQVEPAVWTDASIDWKRFDAVLVRTTWDYAPQRDAFLAWARSVAESTLLLNEAWLLQWNTDKHYLAVLQQAGIPIAPTTFVEPGDDRSRWLDDIGSEFVVKPAVSAGSADTRRYAAVDAVAARAHVARLLDQGRSVMIQPYLSAVDEVGETALIYFDGAFSHAIRKGPLLRLDGGMNVVAGLFAEEQIDPRTPSAQERDLADQVLASIPGGHVPLYARIDLIPDADGRPVLLELELTEPSLFFTHDADAADRLAQATVRRLDQCAASGGRQDGPA